MDSCYLSRFCRWLFGKSFASFSIAIIGIIGVLKSPEIMEKLGDIKKTSDEIKEIVEYISDELKKSKTRDIIQQFRSQQTIWNYAPEASAGGSINQDLTKESSKVLGDILEKELGEKNKSDRRWGIYIKEKDIESIIRSYIDNPTNTQKLEEKIYESIIIPGKEK